MIQTYRDHVPDIDPLAYVHPSAVVIGEVSLAAGSSVWPGVVLRGDQGGIVIGADSNLQDGTIAHCTGSLSETIIGARVTVGHRVILHGCVVEDECLIGMGAILLDNCVIGTGSLIGAGALVPVGRTIPPRSLVLGVPGRVVRTLTDADLLQVRHSYEEYRRLAEEYRSKEAS